jgi:hypothetical protein
MPVHSISCNALVLPNRLTISAVHMPMNNLSPYALDCTHRRRLCLSAPLLRLRQRQRPNPLQVRIAHRYRQTGVDKALPVIGVVEHVPDAPLLLREWNDGTATRCCCISTQTMTTASPVRSRRPSACGPTKQGGSGRLSSLPWIICWRRKTTAGWPKASRNSPRRPSNER